MKYSWSDEEIKELMQVVEKHKKANGSLLDAFEEFAQKNSRQTLSVRNFYYKKIDELTKNAELQKKFNVNISLHQKNNFAKFDERQTQKLLDYIKKRTKEGGSVRSACLELSNNDATKMIRFQNKYIFETKKLKEKNASKNSSSVLKQTQKQLQNEVCSENLIKFPVEVKNKPEALTDGEIQSLFLGLVRLIKNSAKLSVEEENKKQRENISLLLTKRDAELGQKKMMIENLENENENLCKKVLMLKQKLEELRATHLKDMKNKIWKQMRLKLNICRNKIFKAKSEKNKKI